MCIEAQKPLILHLAHRHCKVLNAVVSNRMNQKVKFHIEHGLSGIIGNEFNNTVENPGADQTFYTTTFNNIVQQFSLPTVIHYLSLDIEGAEPQALQTFPFATHDMISMTVERPSASLHSFKF